MQSQGSSISRTEGLHDAHMAISGEQRHQLKAEIAGHPLCEQLVAAHVACLRVSAPIDQLPLIDAQLSHSHHLLRSYAQTATASLSKPQTQELDSLLVGFSSSSPTSLLIIICCNSFWVFRFE